MISIASEALLSDLDKARLIVSPGYRFMLN